MSTFNGKPFSNPKNINLKQGLLRFETTHATNPFGDAAYGLYIDGSGNLIYRNLTTSVTLGAAGGGGGAAPSLDAIYAGDKSLAITAGALTLAGAHASNDVLVVTNASGSGDSIQITSSGSGLDINGTSSTWSFSSAGVNIMKSTTIAGTAGSTSITLTAGDMVMSDGSLAITDADNAASLSVTNDTATTASVFVFAGSGVFTGNTTSSFATLTASGLTTGTALYMPLAALTTGTGIQIVGNAVTTGQLLEITSSVATTVLTGSGRLLSVVHSGNATGTGIIAEVSSAAADETVIFKVTASAALALGTALAVSGSALTTGFGITVTDLDSLTSGIGVHIASAATVIAGAGRLLYVNHTGATSTSGILSEFASSATDETTIVKISSAAMVDGINLHIVGTTGMTTGSLFRATSSTAGVLATNGLISIRATAAYTSTANVGLVDIQASALVGTGTVVNIKATDGSQLTNTLVNIEQTTTTTGYTGNIVSITGTSTTGAANVVLVTSANTTAGNAVKIISGATTTNGRAVLVQANALTTGVGIGFAHTTSVIADGGSMVRLSSSSVDTGGSTNGTIIDVAATGATAATLVKLSSSTAAQTAVTILDVVSSGYTTGFTGSVAKITGASTTGSGSVLLVTGVNTTAGETVKVDASAVTTGTGLLVTSAGVIVTTGELVSLVANGATTSTGVLRISATALTDGWVGEFTGGGASFTATGGILKLAMGAATVGTGIDVSTTGVYTGTTGVLAVSASSATTGNIVVIDGTGLTSGTALLINTTTATLTSGFYIECNDGAASDFTVGDHGATIIAGTAQGTSALTLTVGDLVVSGGDVNFAAKVVFSGTETIAAAGTSTALNLSKFHHDIDADAGGDTFTLADGIQGQITVCVLKSATGIATITPATFLGGTSVTLNAAGDSVMFRFQTTLGWSIIGGNSYAIV